MALQTASFVDNFEDKTVKHSPFWVAKVKSINAVEQTCEVQWFEPANGGEDRLYTGKLTRAKKPGGEIWVNTLFFTSSYLYWNFKLEEGKLPQHVHDVIWADRRMQQARTLCVEAGLFPHEPPSEPAGPPPNSPGAAEAAAATSSHEGHGQTGPGPGEKPGLDDNDGKAYFHPEFSQAPKLPDPGQPARLLLPVRLFHALT